MTGPVIPSGSGSLLNIRVVPRASKTELMGLHGDAIRIRLSAPPVDGKANVELLRFLAGTLNISHRDLEIVSGGSSRSKRVLLHTLSPEAVIDLLGLAPRR